MRFASVVIVVSWVESLLGRSVTALDREEREEDFRFQMVDLGGVGTLCVGKWILEVSNIKLGQLT